MEIYNENGVLLTEEPDLTRGYLLDSTRTVHHEAVIGVPEEGHWHTIAEYPNGGKDVEWIVDVPGVKTQEAYDEEIQILVYKQYTEEEYEALHAHDNEPDELTLLRARVQALSDRNEFMEDCIAEMAMLVYS